MDTNNLSPREMANFSDESRCGDCNKPSDWCSCIKCAWCEETIRDDDAREVMRNGALVHTDECWPVAKRVEDRARAQEREEGAADDFIDRRREGQACVTSETRASAADVGDRIPTAPLGVEVLP